MELWAKQARRLRAFLRSRGQSYEDAEDLIQEAFLRLHAFLESGREIRKPGAFLARTALNLVVDQQRRDRSRHRDEFVVETIEELPIVDLAPTAEQTLDAEQRLEHIRRVLDSLISPRAREVFFLHRLEGFTHEEIAERLRVSVRTVEKDIARAITVIWIERQRR